MVACVDFGNYDHSSHEYIPYIVLGVATVLCAFCGQQIAFRGNKIELESEATWPAYPHSVLQRSRCRENGNLSCETDLSSLLSDSP